MGCFWFVGCYGTLINGRKYMGFTGILTPPFIAGARGPPRVSCDEFSMGFWQGRSCERFLTDLLKVIFLGGASLSTKEFAPINRRVSWLPDHTYIYRCVYVYILYSTQV